MKTILGAFSALFVATSLFGAAQVQPGLPISRYPNQTNLDGSDLFILAVTNRTPPTNMNLTFLSLSNAIATNIISGFAAFETFTNGTRLGLSTNQDWVSFVTGQVSGVTVVIGVDGLALSNAFGIAGFNAFKTNQFTTNVADVANSIQTPVVGGLWLRDSGVGHRSLFTNGSRPWSLEYSPSNGVFRIGALAAITNSGVVDSINNVSSYWDGTNTAFGTITFGSNILNAAPFSSVLGGVANGIVSNAAFSVVAGGSNNVIATNATFGVIGGGNINNILRASTHGTIAGGNGNTIGANTIGVFISGYNNQANANYGTAQGQNCTITDVSAVNGTVSGGSGNNIRSPFATIGGGSGNIVFGATGNASYETIGGGNVNFIGLSPNFGAYAATISGGEGNLVQNGSQFGTESGGRANVIAANSTNSIIMGGATNNITANIMNGGILGGVANVLASGSANSFILGSYMTNSGARRTISMGYFTTNRVDITTTNVAMVGLGHFYKSNAVPWIPTGAELGAGGYWVGNSNGFLVSVYSTDGSTTAMKVLVP